MKRLFNLLSLIKGYRIAAGLNVLFNLLSVVFGLFSIALLIPFLNLIFNSSNEDYARYLASKPEKFVLDSEYIQNSMNYYLADIIMQDPENGRMNALILICVAIISFIFLKNITRYLAYFFLAIVRNGVMFDLRNDIYRKLLGLPIGYFSEEKKGDIMARMTNDVQEVEWTIMTSLEMLFRDPFSIILYLVALFILSPSLTVFVLIVLPISGFIIGRIGKSLKKTSEDGQHQMGLLVSMIEETIGGLRIIKAFGTESYMNEKFKSLNSTYMGYMIKMLRKRDLASPVSEFLGVFIMIVIIWYGGRLILVDQNSSLEAATFLMYIALFTQIISPAKAFTVAMYNVQKGSASLDRIHKILSSDAKIPEKENALELMEFKDQIEYKNIFFSYRNTQVIHGIDLEIKKGQTIALVGPSGSGKSTLADLLPRFYDITKGKITIDGIDIRDLKIKDLRNQIGVVTQQSILFNDTVANNISFGSMDATKEEIIRAAKVANAHEFIMDLPGGYDYNVGDGGTKLSGGQKQRISIARAVLNNPPILILDEATSSLDTESEKEVQEALQKLMENRTSLVIAHRLSTIVNADRIYVLEKGKIIDHGSHNELLERAGLYRKLYELQAFA